LSTPWLQVLRRQWFYRPETDMAIPPFHCGARGGDTEVVRLLVRLWAEGMWDTTRRRDAPLHIATRSGKIDAVGFFIEECPQDIRPESSAGVTQMGLATLVGEADSLRNIDPMG
jgi:hypothetical protein